MFPLDGSEGLSPVLGIMAMDVGSLIFVVEDEPEFEAGVGDSDAYAALTS